MDREEFKFQMYLRLQELRGIDMMSDEDERNLYSVIKATWAPYLNPLADQAGIF